MTQRIEEQRKNVLISVRSYKESVLGAIFITATECKEDLSSSDVGFLSDILFEAKDDIVKNLEVFNVTGDVRALKNLTLGKNYKMMIAFCPKLSNLGPLADKYITACNTISNFS